MDGTEREMDIRWITSAPELADACSRWRELPLLGIDTEFVRTRTFFAQLGLIQIGAEHEVYLVDPLSIEDLKPLWTVLANGPTKVLHSGSEDLEIFVRHGGCAPRPLFDTQVAAGLCGLGPSLSYQALVRELCDIELEKGETRSNWLKRPLTDSQIHYAALDVHLLDELHGQLTARLGSLGRLDWLREDMERITREAEKDQAAEQQFQRFKFAWKLGSDSLEVLWHLVNWREERARIRDIPRNRVLEPDRMLDIARALPTSLQALDRDVELYSGLRRHQGEALVALVNAALATPQEARKPPPPPPLDVNTKPVMKRLKQAVSERSQELDLAAETLCNKRDLTELIRGGALPERLSGWRREVIGESLLALSRA